MDLFATLRLCTCVVEVSWPHSLAFGLWLPVVVCGCCHFCLYANANGVDSSCSYALLGFDPVVFLWFAKVVPTLAS